MILGFDWHWLTFGIHPSINHGSHQPRNMRSRESCLSFNLLCNAANPPIHHFEWQWLRPLGRFSISGGDYSLFWSENFVTKVISNSDLNRPCFAWGPYGKSGLFKTELVIGTLWSIFLYLEWPQIVQCWENYCKSSKGFPVMMSIFFGKNLLNLLSQADLRSQLTPR